LSPTPSNGAPVDHVWDLWYAEGAPTPARVIGPIKVVMIEGKGRGVVATSDLKSGDLVMVSEPLLCLRAKEGRQPDAAALVDEALRRGIHTSKWMSDYLYDGTDRSAAKVPDLRQWRELAAVRDDGRPLTATAPSEDSTDAGISRPAAVQVLAQKKKKVASKAGGFGAAVRGVKAGRNSIEAVQAEKRRITRLIKFNCYGDEHDDRAADACRGEQPEAHIGVWPEMALLNHSCSPNSINYVLGSGSAHVVRAAVPIRAGSEVTISYLGRMKHSEPTAT